MKLGFFEAVGGVDGNEGAALATRDRGGSWDIVTDMAVKLVPGGHPYHALAEAAANAARKAQAAAEAIESITVSRPGLTALSGPLHPKDLVDMAHSPAYFTAAGAADRDFSWANATPAKIADPVIHSLIDKVRVGLPPTENAERYRQGATVTIALRPQGFGPARHRLERHRRQVSRPRPARRARRRRHQQDPRHHP